MLLDLLHELSNSNPYKMVNKNPIMKLLILTICNLVILTTLLEAVTIIDPSDSAILYTGRWDNSNPSEPWCYWIGGSIIANFEGSSISGRFAAGWESNPDYLRVIIDDDVANSFKIAVGSTEANYLLATGLTDTVHKIEIIKETDEWRWLFYRFELDDDKSLAAAPSRPARRIEFYGDSNLAGHSLESELNQWAAHLRGSYFGYAGIVSRMFDAEYCNLSRSGATISDIHNRFDRIDYGSNNPTWDFDAFPPDLVVINLGANNLPGSESNIRSDYHAFLDDLRIAHGDNVHIMLYNAWGWDYDEPANYINEVIAERGDANMSSATFPWIFEQWHGCEYDHAGMAQTLADHLTTVLGWNQNPPDVMSGFGMNGDVANGSFEEVAPFGGYGWRYYTDNGVSRVNDPGGAYLGSHFLRLENGAESHQPIPASDGDTFMLTVWMRGVENNDTAEITMDFRDQEMWTPVLQTATETKTLSTEWQQYSMTATAPSGTPNPVFHTRVTFSAVANSAVDIDGVVMSTPSSVDDSNKLPQLFQLNASPNPFNPSTAIKYHIPVTGDIRLSIFDMLGREVITLSEGHSSAGNFSINWDGRNQQGLRVVAGVYLVKLNYQNSSTTAKLVFLL